MCFIQSNTFQTAFKIIPYQRKDCVTPPAAPLLDAPKKPPVRGWLHADSTKANAITVIIFFIRICIPIKILLRKAIISNEI
ncbi:hypothetical protein EGK75_12330 [Neisseria weixii]|uniref:Uncharacterized protein n=1 Tax=Neisseria weixii TaxID=1853276 RepID=A0A3N4MIX1_9NEIS|nr:hypothetical protein CGZ65_11305 [Neisseria weixii]RPD83602.1 hypothetical protein EGK74_12105 [Neisseria weixii]RPD84176.1 hypothetical protein EGK75_12330 [Neisseria weixii]